MGRLFDPSGKLRDPESLRSIYLGTRRQAKVWTEGDTKVTEVIDEVTGGTAAVQREHGSGRVDAEVFPSPATISGVAQ